MLIQKKRTVIHSDSLPYILIWGSCFALLVVIIGLGCWTAWSDHRDRLRSVTLRTQLLTASIADFTLNAMQQRASITDALALHLLDADGPLDGEYVRKELFLFSNPAANPIPIAISVDGQRWTISNAEFPTVDWVALDNNQQLWLGVAVTFSGKTWLPVKRKYHFKDGSGFSIATLVPLIIPGRYFESLGLDHNIAVELVAPGKAVYWQQGELPRTSIAGEADGVHWIPNGDGRDILVVRKFISGYPLQIVIARSPDEYLVAWYQKRRFTFFSLLISFLLILGASFGVTAAWRRNESSQKRYRHLFHTINDGALLIGPYGVHEANERAALFFGVENVEALKAIPFLELCAPQQANNSQTLQSVGALLHQAEQGIESCSVLKLRRMDQDVFFSCEVKLSQLKLGNTKFVLACLHDISAEQNVEAELRLSQHKLLEAQLIAGLGVWSLEVGARRATWTDECARIFGLPSVTGECEYADFFDSVIPEQRRYAKLQFDRALEGKRLDIELQICRPDGHVRHIVICGELRTHKGRQQLLGALYDITAQKRIEERLSEGQRHYRELLEMLPEGLIILRQFKIVFANVAAAKLFGVDSAEYMIGQHVFDLVDPCCYQIIADDYEQILKEDYIPSFASRRYKRVDGADFEFDVSAQKIIQEKEVCIQVMLRDVSAYRRMQTDLETANARLQRLSNQIIEVQERERLHLSRDLHDDVGQLLTFIKISASGIQRHLVGELEERQAVLVRIAEEALSKVRNLSRSLRPVQLDNLGLAAAIHWQIDSYILNVSTLIDCDLECYDLQPRPDSNIEITLFRIFQEAVTNALKHSAARLIKISLIRQGENILLRVSDDGCGFDYDNALACQAGIGLMSMAERVKLLSGDFSLTSLSGVGTEIRVVIPDKKYKQLESKA